MLKIFDDSMNNLETAAGEGDGYETDSESDTDSVSSAESASSVRILIESMPPKHSDKIVFDDSSDSEEEGERIISAINKSPNLIPNPETKNSEIFVFRPYLQPFQERRRLSQCKEEEEEDSLSSPQPSSQPLPTPPPPVALQDSPMDVGKFRELEKLRQQFMEKLENNSLKLDTPKTRKEKKSQPLKKCLEAKEETKDKELNSKVLISIKQFLRIKNK
uniref:Uncharacterized protein n=1 Tax=Megaselia scalaris TaxID=36166 RepID=T1GYJ6_MEGSC